MYELEHPEYFWFLLSIPLVVALYALWRLQKSKALKKFGSSRILELMAPQMSSNKMGLKIVLWLICLAAISLALVNPKVGSRLENVKRKGVDIVFAIDVSKSMLTEDVKPNRLEKAKLFISKSLDELVSDRVGIIIYAGEAYPQLPITTDYGAARMFLNSISTDLVPTQGTALAEALELSNSFFDDEDQKNRMIVVLSDGEDHEASYQGIAQSLNEKGTKIYTVGFGTERGGPIPVYSARSIVDYKKDKSGSIVLSKKNEASLKEIASISNAKYISGKDVSSAAKKFNDELSKMEKTEFETQVFSDYEDQFQWFLGLVLIIFLIDIFISERKTVWLEKLKNNED